MVDWSTVIIFFIIIVVLVVVGGGIAYFLWAQSRPKKLTWIAKCYQKGEGVKEISDGNLKLNDLIPYIEDILERTEEALGLIKYTLKRLSMSCNEVTSDLVDVWGQDKKEVHVLIDGGTATLMKKGYDYISGTEVFRPMPRERIELIKSELEIKKSRITDKKDLLTTITPWVVTGICMLTMFGCIYFLVDGEKDIAKSSAEAQKYTADKMVEASELIDSAMLKATNFITPPKQLGKIDKEEDSTANE